MSNRIILGLDISTTCTGISIVLVDEEENIKPIVVTHLRHKVSKKLDKIESLFVKCNGFIEKLDEILKENDLYVNGKTIITDVVIEEPLVSSNNKYTVATLLRYNGMTAYKAYELLGIVPTFISSADARKYGVPKLMSVRLYDKKGEKRKYLEVLKDLISNKLVMFGEYPFDYPKKLILWEYVSQKFPDIQWVYNSKNELKKENFDASDSLICILGLIGMEKYLDNKPEVVVTSNDGNSNIEYCYNFCGCKIIKEIKF